MFGEIWVQMRKMGNSSCPKNHTTVFNAVHAQLRVHRDAPLRTEKKTKNSKRNQVMGTKLGIYEVLAVVEFTQPVKLVLKILKV